MLFDALESLTNTSELSCTIIPTALSVRCEPVTVSLAKNAPLGLTKMPELLLRWIVVFLTVTVNPLLGSKSIPFENPKMMQFSISTLLALVIRMPLVPVPSPLIEMFRIVTTSVAAATMS